MNFAGRCVRNFCFCSSILAAPKGHLQRSLGQRPRKCGHHSNNPEGVAQRPTCKRHVEKGLQPLKSFRPSPQGDASLALGYVELPLWGGKPTAKYNFHRRWTYPAAPGLFLISHFFSAALLDTRQDTVSRVYFFFVAFFESFLPFHNSDVALSFIQHSVPNVKV